MISELFMLWDRNSSGALSMEELVHVLAWFFGNDAEQQSRMVMASADLDDSCTLTQPELKAWLKQQEQTGGPKVSDFAPKLIAVLKADGPPPVGATEHVRARRLRKKEADALIDELFGLWDADESGDLSFSELQRVLGWFAAEVADADDEARLPLADSAAQLALSIADADGSKTLDRKELSVWLHEQERAGGPMIASFVPRLCARIREEGMPKRPA